MTRENLNYSRFNHPVLQCVFYVIFEKQVFRMVRVVLSRVTCIYDLQYGTLTLPFANLLSSNTLSSVRAGYKESILLAYFRDSGKRNFYIRYLLFLPFVNRARDRHGTAHIIQGNQHEETFDVDSAAVEAHLDGRARGGEWLGWYEIILTWGKKTFLTVEAGEHANIHDSRLRVQSANGIDICAVGRDRSIHLS